ncbi:MAG TPA: fluoride efflux transporter CrcB [Bryobacteraceae bacterium]|nr:fluoride efflux transporter CrcB [Bryobacteraceae bacterium]
MQTALWISLGAIVGANLRYLVGQYAHRWIPSRFPLGTLVINISASFILGLFLTWVGGRAPLDPRWRLLVAVGFCATYSTYSSYAAETFALLERGDWIIAGLNILVSNLLCLAAVAAGAILARSL